MESDREDMGDSLKGVAEGGSGEAEARCQSGDGVRVRHRFPLSMEFTYSGLNISSQPKCFRGCDTGGLRWIGEA
jgi:hypothetical protein